MKGSLSMKIVQINATCGVGSTGKICVEISKLLKAQNIENYILYSYRTNGFEAGVSYADEKYIKKQAFKARVLGNYGFNSKKSTKNIISALERIKPDVVHLHNIHGHDCNVELLFEYFKKNRTKLVWTFHDCWAFTGYCPYFTLAGCDKWEKECGNCKEKGAYSFFFDRSKTLFHQKKEVFSGLDMTIVTPSLWLKEMVQKSFLKGYPVRIINNGIDLSVFRPLKSNFREKYKIPRDTEIILGVAFIWDVRKGINFFVKLAETLDKSKYKIVLVGTNDEIDKTLPENILSIHRTKNQEELAEIYSVADLFLNPTREDNFPTVNIEALACGTPVVTFNTGGSVEIIDETCGAFVEWNDEEALEKEIIRILTEKPFSEEACVKRAKTFNAEDKFKEYVDLYSEV